MLETQLDSGLDRRRWPWSRVYDGGVELLRVELKLKLDAVRLHMQLDFWNFFFLLFFFPIILPHLRLRLLQAVFDKLT